MNLRGTTIDFDERGTGPTLIHAHGLFGSRAAEDKMPLWGWDHFAEHMRVVRYDARGHGLSGGGKSSEEYVWSNLADDLLALADQVAPDEAIIGGGASMGAATMLWAAAKAPERFARLILVIPPTIWETRAAQAGFYRDRIAVVEQGGKAAFVAETNEAAQPEIFQEVLGDAPPVWEPDVSEELLPWVLRGAAESDLPDPDVISGLAHPTLILAWDTDPGHPVSSAERLAELMPNTELHIARTFRDITQWHAHVAGFLA
ncbi:alpha/beta hydrolase [Streptosporangiaceae bacterium NEAU-GS5]|nr:alpha/beta hydrolase [Streptosporangiaceae bacterium NEAU-GS5]